MSKKNLTKIFAGGYTCIIILATIKSGGTIPEKWVTLVWFTLAAAIGWLLAFILAPASKYEQVVLIKVGRTISAFITGYVLSKIDKPIEAAVEVLTKSITNHGADFALSDMQTIRLLGFFVAIIISTITVYVHRATEYEDTRKNEDEANPVGHPDGQVTP